MIEQVQQYTFSQGDRLMNLVTSHLCLDLCSTCFLANKTTSKKEEFILEYRFCLSNRTYTHTHIHIIKRACQYEISYLSIYVHIYIYRKERFYFFFVSLLVCLLFANYTLNE